MELELAESHLAEKKEKKKQYFDKVQEIESNKCRKWMKNRGKEGFLDFKDE
jgi:hypothetical protein